MSRKTRASKHLFAEDGIISGEYGIDGGYELRRTHASSTGDLRQLEYVLESDYGSARYTMLGGDHYFFNFWLSPERLPTTPTMRSIMQRVRRREIDRAASSLFLESQVLALLALQLGQLDAPSACRSGRSLARADVDKMYEARAVLLACMADPPTLAELARHVGTNEFKLKRGFREVFGTSPYALLLACKLEQARTYLLDTDLTIAEIAYRIGYSDPAHFTHAFRKKYGLRPSDLR